MILLGAAVAAGAAIGAAIWILVRRQRTVTQRMVDRLTRAAGPACVATPVANLDDLDSLDVPPPVARYLRTALANARHLRAVRLRQIGELRIDALSERWMRFEAEHIAVPAATGFVWNARVRIAPLLHVRVRDALLAGEGSGRVSLLSAFPLGADGGTPEMNAGSLHRYLAEAVWYPTALVPSASLRWSGLDQSRASATLTSHGISVSLEFRFAASGAVSGIYTPARWGRFGGGYEQRPWEGHFRGYRRWHGLWVPTEGEVGWHVDGEWRRVWSGRILDLEVD